MLFNTVVLYPEIKECQNKFKEDHTTCIIQDSEVAINYFKGTILELSLRGHKKPSTVTVCISAEFGPGLSHLEHEDVHNSWMLLDEANISTSFLISHIFSMM
jgi:hypothetical protein